MMAIEDRAQDETEDREDVTQQPHPRPGEVQPGGPGWMSTREAGERLQERFNLAKPPAPKRLHLACNKYLDRLAELGQSVEEVQAKPDELRCVRVSQKSRGQHGYNTFWIDPVSVETFLPENRPLQPGENRRYTGRPLGAADLKPRVPKGTHTGSPPKITTRRG